MKKRGSYPPSQYSDRTIDQLSAVFRSNVLTSWRQHLLTILVAAAISWLVLRSGRHGGDEKVDLTLKTEINTISKALESCKQDAQIAKDECQKRPSLTNIKDRIVNLEKETGGFTNSISTIEDQHEQLERTLSQQLSEAKDKLRDRDKKLDDLKTTMQRNKEDVDNILADVEGHVQGTLKTTEAELKNSLDTKTAALKGSLSQLTGEAIAISERFVTVKESLEQETRQAKESAEEMKQAKDDLDKQINEMDEVVQLIRRNALHKGTLLTILLFLMAAIVVLVLAIFVICQRLPPASSTS